MAGISVLVLMIALVAAVGLFAASRERAAHQAKRNSPGARPTADMHTIGTVANEPDSEPALGGALLQPRSPKSRTGTSKTTVASREVNGTAH